MPNTGSSAPVHAWPRATPRSGPGVTETLRPRCHCRITPGRGPTAMVRKRVSVIGPGAVLVVVALADHAHRPDTRVQLSGQRRLIRCAERDSVCTGYQHDSTAGGTNWGTHRLNLSCAGSSRDFRIRMIAKARASARNASSDQTMTSCWGTPPDAGADRTTRCAIDAGVAAAGAPGTLSCAWLIVRSEPGDVTE